MELKCRHKTRKYKSSKMEFTGCSVTVWAMMMMLFVYDCKSTEYRSIVDEYDHLKSKRPLCRKENNYWSEETTCRMGENGCHVFFCSRINTQTDKVLRHLNNTKMIKFKNGCMIWICFKRIISNLELIQKCENN